MCEMRSKYRPTGCLIAFVPPFFSVLNDHPAPQLLMVYAKYRIHHMILDLIIRDKQVGL